MKYNKKILCALIINLSLMMSHVNANQESFLSKHEGVLVSGAAGFIFGIMWVYLDGKIKVKHMETHEIMATMRANIQELRETEENNKQKIEKLEMIVAQLTNKIQNSQDEIN